MKAGIFFILIFVLGVLYISYQVFLPVGLKEAAMRYSVPKGVTTDQISNDLARKEIFHNAFEFSLLHWFIGDTIKDGTYYFTQGMSEYDMYRAFITGPVRREKTITIIEGWTLNRIAEYLASQGLANVSVFLDETKKDWSTSYSFLINTGHVSSLEGYLFPDTYRVFEDASSRDIIAKILSNFDRKFSEEMKRDARSVGLSIHEVVTLASIIEREVANDEDRKLVSDILQRRLKINMALQADSTVNYATGKSMPQASLSDISIDSPYNTYKYRGLPPGPIGNPSLSSLRAVIYPKQNPYFYFLTSADGKVHYSKTFEEHKRKKQKYL